ncbi:hypothetical protein FGADI_6485 [Fusarium gaditjirri]|uniref:Zn(2)-C6 fungal-type domain-containing protein n=1 Tax=Fusarium gaditjirri TaxID=282569 RepID=A0A8H4T7L6_9HYPO|nr:hypothetical protein FGADI_6485 [Fusarium gaditjirri]
MFDGIKTKALLVACLVLSGSALPNGNDKRHWVGTWASMPQEVEPANLAPAPFGGADATAQFENTTLRQTFHMSIGADKIRIRFSNIFGKTDLPITAASIALPVGGKAGVGQIETKTTKQLKFSGKKSVSVPAGEIVYSDPIDFKLKPLSNLALSVYTEKGQLGNKITGHPGSRTTSWMQKGNHVNAASVSEGSTKHWYFANGVDSWAPKDHFAVVLLGDSITDGRGSTDDTNDRWSDALAAHLQESGMSNVAVNNMAAGGNAILSGGLGPILLQRYKRDALEQPGAKFVVVFEGVNDIGPSATDEATQKRIKDGLIAAYVQIAKDSKKAGMTTIGATITQMLGNQYYAPEREVTRVAINDWILKNGTFDHTVDFAALIGSGDKLLPQYDSGDVEFRRKFPSITPYLAVAENPGLEQLKSSLNDLVVCDLLIRQIVSLSHECLLQITHLAQLKMSWARDELDKKGFFFDGSIRRTAIPWAPFPAHVEALRQSMLDFTCQDFDVTSDQDAATQHVAKRYSKGGYSESDWEDFFRKKFFDPLVQTASGSPGDSRRVSRNNYYYDHVVFDTDALWETFNGKGEDVDCLTARPFETVKCPKPDYAFYLPMYHLTTESRIPEITDHRAREWHKAPTPSLVESFSWSNLKMLHKNGLRPTPFRVFNKEPREKDLKCFPWLLVEYKKEKYTSFERERLEETVSCQAANGSASAIKLNQIAARYTIELPDEAHIPPIPVVTTVGPKVKVWITYLAKDCMVRYRGRYLSTSIWARRSQAYIMKCIWKGDMTVPQDIVKFRLILENTYTWATRVFKPLITTYIDQWRFVYSGSGPESTSATMSLARRQQAMQLSGSALPLIQGVLDRQSSFELDDSLHHRLTPMLMGVLVQQICAAERQTLTQEMDRIVAEKVGALILNAGASSCPGTSNARTVTTDKQTQESSQATAANIEDPKDDDYVDSQPHRSGSNDSTSSTPTGGLRRSTRLNPQAPSVPSSTPIGQTPRTPDSGSRAGKKPLFPSLPKEPESQSGYSRPVVESEPESDPERSTTSRDGDRNTGDDKVTPLPSPSAASSTIFTPTDDTSARSPVPSMSPIGPAPALRLADPSSSPVPSIFSFWKSPPTASPPKIECGVEGDLYGSPYYQPCPIIAKHFFTNPAPPSLATADNSYRGIISAFLSISQLPNMPPANAFTSCEACRRLKRKCSRDTPSCRLCARLGKACNYGTEHAIPSLRTSTNGLVQQDHTDAAMELALNRTNNFPSSYFLDSDLFQPISRDILTTHDGPFFLEQQRRFTTAGTFDSLIDHYKITIHHWLPMLSIKRLKQDAKALGDSTRGVVDVLAFLALEALVIQSDEHTILPQSNPSYLKAKHGSFIAETGGTVNIRLIQTLVLIVLYEYGHRIYPAAYLTIGQAVRLATVIGLHSQKDAQQLFVEPETWTLCEEQRRTWWAIIMLDRVVVAGSPQLLTAAPGPTTNDLLPCSDDDWTNGRIGFNEALFTRNFHSPSSVGQFARVCQAVHMLGKVLGHIKAREKDTDPVELSAEALQLHTVLEALDQGIMSNDSDKTTALGSLHSALSLCSLARLLLYNEYACNEPSFSMARERLAAEVQMQQISLANIQDIVSKTMPEMARQIVSVSQQQSKGPRHSPILAGCLYHAATECAWFVKENNDVEMVDGFEAITHALKVLNSEWAVCDEYLSYLEGNKTQN